MTFSYSKNLTSGAQKLLKTVVSGKESATCFETPRPQLYLLFSEFCFGRFSSAVVSLPNAAWICWEQGWKEGSWSKSKYKGIFNKSSQHIYLFLKIYVSVY